MKKVSFEGVGAKYLTFNKAENATINKGDFVSISGNNTVSVATEGEIVGKCTDVCGDLVTVQVSGYMKASVLSGQTVTHGRCHLGINSSGKLKVVSSAPGVLVVDIDSVTGEVGFIL